MYSLRIAAACFHEEVEENQTILSFIRRLDEAKLTHSHFGMELEEESFRNLKNSLDENSLFDGTSSEVNFDFNFCGKVFKNARITKYFIRGSIAMYLAYVPELKLCFVRSLLERNNSPFVDSFLTPVTNQLSEAEKKIFVAVPCIGLSGITELTKEVLVNFFSYLEKADGEGSKWEEFSHEIDKQSKEFSKERMVFSIFDESFCDIKAEYVELFPFTEKKTTTYEKKGDLITKVIKDHKSIGLVLYHDSIAGIYEFNDQLGLTLKFFNG